MDKCKTTEILKDHNIRLTKARIMIMDIIINQDQPFSVSELFANYLQKSKTEITTIYRFILVLTEKKILREIGSFDNNQFYELACVHNPVHPHFYCNSCHKIQCLKQLNADDFIRLSEYSEENKITEIKIIMGGTCEKCKKKHYNHHS